MVVNVRVRGIYATALTRRCLRADHSVVQASDPIRERFDALATDPEDASFAPAAATVATTDDRLGVGVTGTPEAVDALEDVCTPGVDTLAFDAALPRGAVFDGRVTDALGAGCVVDCGDGEGYLPYDAVDAHVEAGDAVRVQVHEPAAPWTDDRPVLDAEIRVPGDLVVLSRGRSGVTAAANGGRATELVRTTDLLSTDPPEGWGVRWQHAALDASMNHLDDALAAASDTADAFADLPDAVEPTRQLAAPTATTWLWYGRESRFALDDDRREVAPTMPGHHRVKAGSRSAGAAVDFAEALCDPAGEFPFGAVAGQFGPTRGDRLAIGHGKPDGRYFTLGRGEVTEWRADGKVMVRRELSSSGTYDALGTQREPGDVAVTKLTEGRWWYPTVYRGADGERKGTYVNVCTPVELFPDVARYVDLHVDVVKRPDGTVERVDDDELDAAVADGELSAALAAKARSVAASVERALS
jgi:hypothetical protein